MHNPSQSIRHWDDENEHDSRWQSHHEFAITNDTDPETKHGEIEWRMKRAATNCEEITLGARLAHAHVSASVKEKGSRPRRESTMTSMKAIKASMIHPWDDIALCMDTLGLGIL